MAFVKELKYQAWAIAWTLLILFFCCVRTDGATQSGFFFIGFDKLVHCGFFYVLTVLIFFGKINYQHNYRFTTFTILKIILITAAIGGGIEFLQANFFTYRSAEWWDFCCDMIGVMMGVFSYVLLHKKEYEK